MKLAELELDNKTTAEYKVSEFFKCWIDRDFEKINEFIQGTWLYHHGEDGFEKMYGQFELTDFYIYDKEIITDCRQEVDFRADIVLGDKPKSMYGKANVICEEAPYKPTPDGEWGVNPLSLLRWQKG